MAPCVMIVKTVDGGEDKIVKTVDGGVDKIVTSAGKYGWKRCDTLIDYCTIPEAEQPATDIALLYIGTPTSRSNLKLVKCYFDECTLTGTEPDCVIEPDDTPLLCSDSILSTEDFAGNVAVPCKFTARVNGNASIVYAAGKVSLSCSGPGSNSEASMHDCYPLIGTTADYETSIKVTNWSGTNSDSSWMGLNLYLSDWTDYGSISNQGGHGVNIHEDSGTYYVVGHGGGSRVSLSGASSVTLRVRRVSGTAYEEYNTGSGWNTLYSYASTFNVKRATFSAFAGNPTEYAWSADFDDWSWEA